MVWPSEVLQVKAYDAAGMTVISMKLEQAASLDDNGSGRLGAVPITAIPQLSPQLPFTKCAARALNMTVVNFMLAKIQIMTIL